MSEVSFGGAIHAKESRGARNARAIPASSEGRAEAGRVVRAVLSGANSP